MEKIKIDGLYEAAKNAYRGISFDPEKRAISIVEDQEEQLNSDLEAFPEHEHARYIENYKKHLFAWLSALSRCLSPMITGPSRFPTERNRKANEVENKRLNEFIEWRDKAIKAIARKVEDAKPEEVKRDERWLKIEQNITSSAATIIGIDNGTERGLSRPLFVSSIANFIKRLADNGEADLVGRCLDLLQQINERKDIVKPVISKNHSVWKMRNVATVRSQKLQELAEREDSEETINGVRVVRCWSEDRLQLFFDGKPASEMITKLKKHAFKWSPSRGCWQRQLTSNAISAMRFILQ